MDSRQQDFDQANALQAAGQLQPARQLWQQLLQQHPQDWQARLNYANVLQQLGDYPAALDAYLAVLAQQPGSLSARCNLAQLLKILGEYATAASLLQEVLQAEPHHVDALAALALVCGYLCQPEQAVALAQRACELAPQRPALVANLGLLLTNARAFDEAEQVLSNGIQRFGPLPDLCWNRSIVRLYQGDYAAAWPDYEARFDAVFPARHGQLARFDPERHQGQRVLLWAEQGLGDSIMMLQLLPGFVLCHGVTAIIEAPRSLHPLLHTLLPDAELYDDAAQVAVVAQLPWMSLPLLCGLTREALPARPYLAATDSRQARWQPQLAAVRRQPRAVGLVWQSGAWGIGAADYNRQRKSVPLTVLQSLLQVSGVDWFSLQTGLGAGECLPVWLHDLGAQIADFADTAAIVSQLDLVITVDTATAHLAAAMGKPVWVLMRYEGAPFFGEDDSMPWYPSVTVLRQPRPGDWQLPVANCIDMLKSWQQ